MKKELIAWLLLVLLIVGSALNIGYIDRLTSSVKLCLSRSEAAAEQGDFAAALNALDSGLEIWRQSDSYANIFIRHTEIDSSYECFYELQELLLQQDEAFPAAYAKLINKLDSIAYMERISIGTVL